MAVMMRGGAAALVLLVVVVPAWANFGRAAYYGSYSYYPIYSQPAYLPVMQGSPHGQPCLPAPGVSTTAPPFARPTPAPPSSTPPPVVSETRTNSPDTTGQKPSVVASAKDRCRVGFWNVSGRDVVLTVEGQKHFLPANKSITLPVSRVFTWQQENQPSRTERVPEDRLVQEIILRD